MVSPTPTTPNPGLRKAPHPPQPLLGPQRTPPSPHQSPSRPRTHRARPAARSCPDPGGVGKAGSVSRPQPQGGPTLPLTAHAQPWGSPRGSQVGGLSLAVTPPPQHPSLRAPTTTGCWPESRFLLECCQRRNKGVPSSRTGTMARASTTSVPCTTACRGGCSSQGAPGSPQPAPPPAPLTQQGHHPVRNPRR